MQPFTRGACPAARERDPATGAVVLLGAELVLVLLMVALAAPVAALAVLLGTLLVGVAVVVRRGNRHAGERPDAAGNRVHRR